MVESSFPHLLLLSFSSVSTYLEMKTCIQLSLKNWNVKNRHFNPIYSPGLPCCVIWAGLLRVRENLENLLIFLEVREKSWIFFVENGESHGKSQGIYSLVPRIFSNRRGQFKGNSSNLREVKLPDLTMVTMCDCFVLSVTLCLKLTISVDLIMEKYVQNHGIVFYAFFCPGTMTTHAESINSDLQRGLDRRLRHTEHCAQNRTSLLLMYQRTTNTTATLVVMHW